MNPPLLQLKQINLTASVGVDYLLRDISFTVNKGEKIAIVGASGSGKTSLLRLLNRLVSPTEGTICFSAKPYQEHNIITLRRQIMLVPQEPKLLGMIGKETLIYPLQLQQLSSTKISDRIIKYCNLLQIPSEWLERHELQLSLGQRQLITIARALILEPTILLLDEPTSALDIKISDRLLEVFNQLTITNQMTILMVNHQLEIAQKFSGAAALASQNRILYLDSGKLLKDIPATPENWQQIERLLLQEKENNDW
jgi:D-methionine transport system ATP-binding protein